MRQEAEERPAIPSINDQIGKLMDCLHYLSTVYSFTCRFIRTSFMQGLVAYWLYWNVIRSLRAFWSFCESKKMLISFFIGNNYRVLKTILGSLGNSSYTFSF